MRITAITVQKKNKERVNIYIDDAFALGLDLETTLSHGLKLNQEITPQELERLGDFNEVQSWYNKSLNLLSFRPRSTKEISDYLQKHKVDEEVCQKVLEKLASRNILDDRAFAQWFIEQRMAFRPKGAQVLKLELRQKGIKDDVISDVLSTLSIDESGQAKKLVDKKMRQWEKYPPEVKLKKIQDFLMRRGFSWETVKQVAKDLI